MHRQVHIQHCAKMVSGQAEFWLCASNNTSNICRLLHLLCKLKTKRHSRAADGHVGTHQCHNKTTTGQPGSASEKTLLRPRTLEDTPDSRNQSRVATKRHSRAADGHVGTQQCHNKTTTGQPGSAIEKTLFRPRTLEDTPDSRKQSRVATEFRSNHRPYPHGQGCHQQTSGPHKAERAPSKASGPWHHGITSVLPEESEMVSVTN